MSAGISLVGEEGGSGGAQFIATYTLCGRLSRRVDEVASRCFLIIFNIFHKDFNRLLSGTPIDLTRENMSERLGLTIAHPPKDQFFNEENIAGDLKYLLRPKNSRKSYNLVLLVCCEEVKVSLYYLIQLSDGPGNHCQGSLNSTAPVLPFPQYLSVFQLLE